ncbi:hypothetical protein J3Q64DRAFT_1704521 [Phycomyces blakesleeanus]|uniref:Uncharacterized protein n=2 Tax=Phycomyces blakesleeanus TaxID=4837 RepID=A0A167LAC4_PHYB8|nr:hypothetical protein PHYBLDRAFT_60301 [Phycomyces blakesleeanus NRRL 1555(-)]OAD69975.1 hypothetical protein PHYBLDRAFT_60301 [Phycomyces blakesleeanus NRRL 1555(-)]|eukprot:XP_018288015.1 hypothetical protein PHYBLDRAFT_60301 [Phycomyces blakesleeanus NRRL 1555(-)]
MILSKSRSSTVNVEKFVKHIKTRASVGKLLWQYQGNEIQKSKEGIGRSKIQKIYEPTRNKGLIRILKKNWITVYLIDEFKASSKFPNCEEDLETFETIINPCPYNRATFWLIRCKNSKCLAKESKRKSWNRDLAAVLNFRKILINLRNTTKHPDIFFQKTRI